MVCISELRGLQNFQAKHPETIVVAMNVLEDQHEQDAIDRLIKKQKLDMLRVAQGKEWQDKFRLPEQIPVTLLVDGGKVRIIHDSVMADPVSFLDADLEGIHVPAGDPRSAPRLDELQFLAVNDQYKINLILSNAAPQR